MQLLWCDMFINLDATDKKVVSPGLFYGRIMSQNIGIVRNIAIGEFKIWVFVINCNWRLGLHHWRIGHCNSFHLTCALALIIKFFNQVKPYRVVESPFENVIVVNLSKVVSNATKYIFGLIVFSQIDLLHHLTDLLPSIASIAVQNVGSLFILHNIYEWKRSFVIYKFHQTSINKTDKNGWSIQLCLNSMVFCDITWQFFHKNWAWKAHSTRPGLQHRFKIASHN